MERAKALIAQSVSAVVRLKAVSSLQIEAGRIVPSKEHRASKRGDRALKEAVDAQFDMAISRTFSESRVHELGVLKQWLRRREAQRAHLAVSESHVARGPSFFELIKDLKNTATDQELANFARNLGTVRKQHQREAIKLGRLRALDRDLDASIHSTHLERVIAYEFMARISEEQAFVLRLRRKGIKLDVIAELMRCTESNVRRIAKGAILEFLKEPPVHRTRGAA